MRKFQLALPRRERRLYFTDGFLFGMVSTRAPAKGATDVNQGIEKLELVSTRAPAKGATGKYTPAGIVHKGVSTRAPAKGATGRWCKLLFN